jgi:hypothetical protein
MFYLEPQLTLNCESIGKGGRKMGAPPQRKKRREKDVGQVKVIGELGSYHRSYGHLWAASGERVHDNGQFLDH